jgi:hypothetical protein
VATRPPATALHTITPTRLPIVEPAEAGKRRLEALVDQLPALGSSGPQAEALEREVDVSVYGAHGLTPDEIAEIERWHAERRALLSKRGNGAGAAGADDAAASDDDGAEE